MKRRKAVSDAPSRRRAKPHRGQAASVAGLSNKTLSTAAAIIALNAQALKDSHTVGEKWGTDKFDREARREYRDYMAIARKLIQHVWARQRAERPHRSDGGGAS